MPLQIIFFKILSHINIIHDQKDLFKLWKNKELITKKISLIYQEPLIMSKNHNKKLKDKL
jgi:hypothetical protein